MQCEGWFFCVRWLGAFIQGRSISFYLINQMTLQSGSSSNDTMWPTLGKRGAIAKPAEPPTKKARRRELRNRNLKLHLVFEAGNIPEVLEEKIEAHLTPKWMTVYRETFGNLFHIQHLPTEGPACTDVHRPPSTTRRCDYPRNSCFGETHSLVRRSLVRSWSRCWARGCS